MVNRDWIRCSLGRPLSHGVPLGEGNHLFAAHPGANVHCRHGTPFAASVKRPLPQRIAAAVAQRATLPRPAAQLLALRQNTAMPMNIEHLAAQKAPETLKNFIAGRWVASSSNETLAAPKPATE